MSALSSVDPSPPVQPSAAPEESVVARWTVEDREVRLLRQQDKLAFSVYVDGIESKRGTVPLNLYDISYALNIVTLFHKVIEANLRQEVVPSAFLPVLCTDALCIQVQDQSLTPATHLKVALFGRVNGITGEVSHGRFGVFDSSDNTVSGFPVNDRDDTTRQFLLNAPRYDRPHEDEKSLHHYAVTRYAKPFRPIVICAPTGKIQGVALSRVSRVNRDVMINEIGWAVTLLSANHNSGFCGIGSSAGHAMMACEGVKKNEQGEESQFLTYAHITTVDKEEGVPDPGRGSDARVDLFDRETPLTNFCTYGPTWVQSKEHMETMIQSLRTATNTPQYVRFAREGDVPLRLLEDFQRDHVTEADKRRSPVKSAIRSWFQRMMTSALESTATAATERDGRRRTNCKDWCIEQLKLAHIHVVVPANVLAPSALIERLNNTPQIPPELEIFRDKHPCPGDAYARILR